MQYTKAIDFALGKLQKDLPVELKYHSLEHTLGVMHSCEIIAAMNEVSQAELNLLKTAAAYHDIGFTESYENHEQNGCKIAADILPQFDFDEASIAQIQGMIMATKIPQQPQNQLEQILCDADLDYLGGDQYGEISQRLYEEIGLKGKSMSMEEWLDLQINFLDQHHYWTNFVQEKLGGRKAKVLERLKQERLNLNKG